MLRSSIGARLASVAAASFLIAGLFAQATPALAASPAHVLPAGWAVATPAQHVRSQGTVNIGALIGKTRASLPFDAAAASAALASMEARDRTARANGAKVAPSVVTPPPPDPVTSSGAAAPTTPVAVAAQTEPGSGIVEPANPGIGAAADEIVQVDGSESFLFTDRTGTSAGSISLPSFFDLPEPSNGAPYTTWDSNAEVHFDTLRQRWIASELSWDCALNTYPGDTAVFGHGYIDYAISDTSDPQGSWSFDDFGWNDLIPTQPEFGTSTDKLGFSANQFNLGAGGSTSNPGCTSGSFQHAEIIIEDWSQLGPHFDFSKILSRFFTSPAPDMRFAIQEPVTAPELRMINADIAPLAGNLDYTVATGSAKANTLSLGGADLTGDAVVPGTGTPPSPHQPGGTLTTAISGDPDNVVFHNGILAFTLNYPCTPTGDSSIRDCVRVVTLNNAVALTEPTRLGDTLIGTNGFDDSFGGIGWSASGALHVVYTRSSGSSDASSYESYNLPTDASSAWSAAHLLTAGTTAYTGTLWGGDPTVATDPQDPNAVWVSDAYSGTAGKWFTRIHQVVVGGGGAGYFPITPIRVLDSRDGTGLPGHTASAFVSNVPKTFPVAGVTINAETIPSDAVAITGNLTVTGQTAAGFLALTQTPTVTPSSSTLNFPLGDTRANNVTIALGPDGSLAAVYKAVAGKHASVILDVTGYFRIGAGQTYFPITSARILDSRDGTGQPGHTPALFVANVAQSFPVQGVGGVPVDATAITANLTVTGQTKPGFVAVTPAPDNAPGTSTLNFPIHDNRANGLTIPINVDGTVSAVYKAVSGTANLILDVTGYYTNAGGGLLFHPLNPGRLVDTRAALGLAGLGNQLTGAQGTTSRSIAVAGHVAVPASAAAITGNLTITAQTGPGFVAVTDASVALPATSTINFPFGDTRANGITTTLGSGDLWFVYRPTAGKTVQLILDITGYFQ